MRKERLQVIILKETKNLFLSFFSSLLILAPTSKSKKQQICQGNNCQVAFRNNTPL
jgi:hypothetical protein